MTPLWDWVSPVFTGLLRVSGQAGVLVVLILLTQALLGKRLEPRWRCALWLLVVVRLLLPVPFASSFSIFNLIPPRPPAQTSARVPSTPAKTTFTQRTRVPAIPPASGATPAQTLASGKPMAPAAATSALQNPPLAQAPWSWPAWAALVWSAGAAGLGLRIIWQNILFSWSLRWEPTVTNAAAWEVLEENRLLMSVRYRLVLVETSLAHSPALYGFWRLHLLLPEQTLAAFSPDELRYVFLHELAHVKRRDMLVNWFLTVLRVVHWFNPLIWLAFRRMATDRELAADALALSCVEVRENKAYGQAIIKLIENLLRPAPVTGLIGILEDKNQMKRRMSMIAKYKPTKRGPMLAVAAFASLALIALTDAQPNPQSKNAAATPIGASADAGAASAPSHSGQNAVNPRRGARTIADPKTGIRFTQIKAISGPNDVIEYTTALRISPNQKFLLSGVTVVPLDGTAPFKLVDDPSAGRGVWSPDGTKVVFFAHGIWLVSVSADSGRPTGAAKKLLEGKYDSQAPADWSPDSTRIVFQRRDQEVASDLYILSVKDGTVTRLTDDPDAEQGPLWSPDGDRIAFYNATAGGTEILSVKDKTKRKIIDGEWPASWSPDGRWLLTSDGETRLRFVNTADGTRREMEIPPEVGGQVAWSSDGKSLLFYRESYEMGWKLRLVSRAGGPSTELAKGQPLYPYAQCWSPDSRWVITSGKGAGPAPSFWVIPINGQPPRELSLMPGVPGTPIPRSLSPDGEKLQFAIQTNSLEDVWVVPVSLAEARTTGPAARVFRQREGGLSNRGNTSGVWSPDSQRMISVHLGDLWVGSVAGGEPVQLTRTPEAEADPVWSPDGKTIAYTVRQRDARESVIRLISASGGEPRTLLGVTLPGESGWEYAWSSDGKDLAAISENSMVRITVATGEVRPLLRLSELAVSKTGGLSWCPDGRCVSFGAISQGRNELFLLDLATGKAAPVGVKEPGHKSWPTWSPDGQWLSYASLEYQKIRPEGVLWGLDFAQVIAQLTPPSATR